MPLLTTTQAHLSALALTLSYVGSLYLSRLAPSPSSARPVSLSTDDVLTSAVNDMTTSIEPVCMDLDRARSEASLSRSPSPAPGMRDHPDTIRARIKAVIGSTIASWVGVWGVVRMGLGEGGKSTPFLSQFLLTKTYLGITSPTLIFPFLLAPILFAGPLYTSYLDNEMIWQSHGRGFGWLGRGKERLSLIEVRNFIAGPISEELVFRSCIIAVYALSGKGWKWLVFGTPMWFGVAHAHHAFEMFVKGGKTFPAAIQASVASVFQFTYTTLFGWFAAFLFVKTHSIIPPIASHIFCNIMGLPNPFPTIATNPRQKTRIILAYILGIAGFAWGVSMM